MGTVSLLLVLGWAAVGLIDRGIYPELASQVVLAPPRSLANPAGAWLRVDQAHRLVTLYDGEHAVFAYRLSAGAGDVPVGPSDAADIRRLVGPSPRVQHGPPPSQEDQDGDGLVDRLDVLIGAKKLVLNGASYIPRYRKLSYPGGDVPRAEGVCTDTIIRALRNAGIDLQREMREDILRAPRAYPMVKRPDPNIDHRRVKTMLPWLRRHLHELSQDEPLRPGDIVLFDTFPSKAGPDHIGIVSDRPGESGKPLIINNWTDGHRDAEMDLLRDIPVTHRFRVDLGACGPRRRCPPR